MGVRHRRIFGKGVSSSHRHPQHVRVYLMTPAVAFREKSDIDPILSPDELLQAKSTWEQLFREEAVLRENQKQNFEENKVIRMQIFTSPLKRCIDTAMMLLAATLPDSPTDHQFRPENMRFPLPLTSSENDCNDKKSVNVVVLNGLCDANYNVQLHGGAARIVSEGLLDCAAASILDTKSGIYKGNKIDHILVRTRDEMKNETFSIGRKFSKITFPYSKVQFWREDSESNFCGFAPMNSQESSQTTQKDLNDVIFPEKTQSGQRRVIVSSPRFPERDSFMGAINHAAHLTAKANTPVCLIITDLDGMKLLVKSCGYKHEDALQDGTTIAKFIATVHFPTVGLLSDHGAFSINWSFYGSSTNGTVEESDKISPAMSSFLSLSRCNSSRIQISLNLDLIHREESHPAVEHVTLGLLAPPLDSSLLGSASIPNNLSITYYNKKKRVLKEIEKDNGVDVIPLDILHGRHKIANFIQFLKEERGTACGTFESNDGSLRTFVIDPLKQPAFPCPPCSLYIVLHS